MLLCGSRNYPYPPDERSLEILRGWASQQPKVFKESEEGGGGGGGGGGLRFEL